MAAHQHFLDPEWDGEPMAPEPQAERPDREDEDDAGDAADTGGEGTEPAESGVRRQPVKVRLADGKARNIQYMTSTSFWHPDGRPMSAAAVYGTVVRKAAGVLSGRGRAAAAVERPADPATAVAGTG
ncbi:MAG UNVERIFIED_CONTAM: hypothetical protein LVR18_52135 [Planctomycetaceae bacterium]